MGIQIKMGGSWKIQQTFADRTQVCTGGPIGSTKCSRHFGPSFKLLIYILNSWGLNTELWSPNNHCLAPEENLFILHFQSIIQLLIHAYIFKVLNLLSSILHSYVGPCPKSKCTISAGSPLTIVSIT